MDIKSQLLVLKYKVRQQLGLYPWLFFPVMQLFGSQATRDRLFSKKTRFVIEGFPRSGNTFALVAFEFVQSQPVSIAHHLHAPAQVIRAMRNKVPTLVIVRNPVDAVLSLFVFAPWVPATEALRAYYYFYTSIQDLSDGFVVATFEEVTSDYGKVIKRVNEKFHMNFEVFLHTPENVENCFKIVDQKDKKLAGRQDITTAVARPTVEKEKLKMQYAETLNGIQEQALLKKCLLIYKKILSKK